VTGNFVYDPAVKKYVAPKNAVVKKAMNFKAVAKK